MVLLSDMIDKSREKPQGANTCFDERSRQEVGDRSIVGDHP